MMLLIDQYGDLPSVVFFLGRVMVFPIFRSHQNHIKKCSQRRTQTFHRILWLDPGPRLPKRGKQALWLNDVASTLQSYLESLSHEIYNSKSSIMLFWIKLDPKISISTTSEQIVVFWINRDLSKGARQFFHLPKCSVSVWNMCIITYWTRSTLVNRLCLVSLVAKSMCFLVSIQLSEISIQLPVFIAQHPMS